ncbi:MAG: UDP-N-acetylglucosamine 2-epimerase (non-hydrolyzing) [Syntrophobacterales bacterium]|jgi:UDP-N-acetylglucosamine 2-epimerase (non-hydrolysing)
MKNILLVFGTRPEAIKMAPVALRLQETGDFWVRVAVTAQHRQMLDQVLDIFGLVPDFDLNLKTPDQDLFDVTVRVLSALKGVLQQERPDLVMVHGDTTTTLAAALAAYYCQIPVGHVEAGLRTRDKYRPYPEELNRHLTGVITDYHFAPTPWARDNLMAESVPAERIWVTGNTVIDALKIIEGRVKVEKDAWLHYLAQGYALELDSRRLILVTGHRRENFGAGFENICLAIRDLAEQYPDIHIIYPVHLNPNVQQPVYEILASSDGGNRETGASWHTQIEGGGRISLLPPLDYAPFIFLMSRSYLVLTDSGGIQEEAPALGKPVLVMREVTERPEGVWAGTLRLVGTNRNGILAGVRELLEDPASYQAMAQAQNPYGDGLASHRIVEILKEID